MGVTGLWTVVQPCARPIKIETLNKKRLAVDASIWIYQFLKAVRDKEGHALRNSHVVGFFRRICKLLFIGIKPVFVFDGGAPALKRQTISGRKQRREGRREDAVRTAGKLLALQMQRRAEEEEQNRKEGAKHRTNADEEEVIPENVIYASELQMTPQERQQNRKFKKKDQYHLPELDMSMSEMGGPNDPRVMSLAELEEYARQFNAGEDINIYDFSKIDFNSAFFLSLPPSDRYNILNAARLRSRLRMGYSKDQLDTMFPDRMAFSKFQIERVAERNELTQRLMRVNGMGDDATWTVDGTGRVSGEKGREYVLVKNESVEGGWALGVIGDKTEGERSKPIDVERMDEDKMKVDEDDSQSEGVDGFEDVPVEGLNRLPRSMLKNKTTARKEGKASTRDILQQREALYKSRLHELTESPIIAPDEAEDEEDNNQLFYSTQGPEIDEEGDSNDEENLQKAISMSMQPEALGLTQGSVSDEEEDDYAEVFGGAKAEEDMLSDARLRNQDQNQDQDAGEQAESDDDDEFDLGKALAKSNQSGKAESNPSTSKKDSKNGPLPFESLDLGSSILGKMSSKKDKANASEPEEEGGFVKDTDADPDAPKPLPPWFARNENFQATKPTPKMSDDDQPRARQENGLFDFSSPSRIRRQDTREVINVDDIEEKQPKTIDITSDDENESSQVKSLDTVPFDSDIRMGDLAEKVRAPSPRQNGKGKSIAPANRDSAEPYEWEQSDNEDATEPAGGRLQVPEETSPSPDIVFEDVPVSRSNQPAGKEATEEDVDEDEVFEDVPIANTNNVNEQEIDDEEGPIPAPGTAPDELPADADFDDPDLASDPEEDELMRKLAAEAEEHARFASQLNNKSYSHNIEEYEKELKALRNQQKKDRRDADEVTQIMVQECQQLLKLFGIPFITAPMEAEAQCAELVSLGLVDGIVTDDSDIFLFGGTRIYKNMFNQAKYVECYLATDLERDFDLTRPRLIRLAQLLGSDYTEGIPGVGPVTALEIIAEFPNGLEEFRDWWTGVQTGVTKAANDSDSAFRKKFRKNAARVFLPPNFPDQRVDLAYKKPEVDSDPSAFQWGVPDLDSLRAFLMATIGWSQERTDEVLVPVIRDMNRREHEGTQSNITNFLGANTSVGAGAFAPRVHRDGKSKRMETALGRMAARAQEKKKRKRQGRDENEDGEEQLPEEYVDPEDAVIAVPGSALDELEQGATPQRRGKPIRMADMALSDDEEEEAAATPAKSRKKSKGKKKQK